MPLAQPPALPAAVLLAGRPGPLRSALAALLLSLPGVGQVLAAAGAGDLLAQAAAARPALVIFVGDLAGGSAALAGEIRRVAPGCKIAVLRNGEPALPGADLVLQQGARPAELVAALEALLGGR